MKFIKHHRSIAKRSYRAHMLFARAAVLFLVSIIAFMGWGISSLVSHNVSKYKPNGGVVDDNAVSITRAFEIAKQQAANSQKNTSKTGTPAAPPNGSAGGNQGSSGPYCMPDVATGQKLAAAQSPILKKYADYVKLCGAGKVGRLMLFTGLPTSTAIANSMAADVSTQLKEFAAFGLKPLVIAEPTCNGSKLNLVTVQNGAYNTFVDQFFAKLKQQGITDTQMGLWVPFPEANIPDWGNTDPNVFAANVTSYVSILKKYFPNTEASIVLDALSYRAVSGGGFDDGAYVSLTPYVNNIPRGLLSSFGFQGFPWVVKATDPGHETNETAQVFLPAQEAIDAATALGVKNVWLNTGTFSEYYTNDPADTIHRTTAERTAVLAGVAGQIVKLQSSGLKVSVNLFAEDKSHTEEAVNWSYWPSGSPGGSDTSVYVSFAEALNSNNVDLWLFDTL